MVVDFSQYAGKTSSSTATLRPRSPHSTPHRLLHGYPDLTPPAACPRRAGYGPNTRTIMQIHVAGNAAQATNCNVLNACDAGSWQPGCDADGSACRLRCLAEEAARAERRSLQRPVRRRTTPPIPTPGSRTPRSPTSRVTAAVPAHAPTNPGSGYVTSDHHQLPSPAAAESARRQPRPSGDRRWGEHVHRHERRQRLHVRSDRHPLGRRRQRLRPRPPCCRSTGSVKVGGGPRAAEISTPPLRPSPSPAAAAAARPPRR